MKEGTFLSWTVLWIVSLFIVCCNGFSLVSNNMPTSLPTRPVTTTTVKGFRNQWRTGPLMAKRTKRKKRKTDEDSSAEEQPVTTSAASAVKPTTATTTEKETTVAVAAELKPRDDGPVQLKVLDVRDVVAGRSPSESSSSSPEAAAYTTSSGRTTSSSVATPSKLSGGGGSSSSSGSPRNVKDLLPTSSLEQLLEDARQMQEEQGGSDGSGANSSNSLTGGGGGSNEDDGSIKAKARSILSTIVTVDFFIVFGFLLWFLAGIFASYVIKDDTVQIAFNNNFETFVQPALGVLMLGTVAGNALAEEEEDMM